MKAQLLLLLSMSCGALFGQIEFQPPDRPNPILRGAATVHDLKQAGDGTVLAVGEMITEAGEKKPRVGFVAYYDGEQTNNFNYEVLATEYGSGLHAVWPEERGDAWVAGYQTDEEGRRRGLLHLVAWDPGKKQWLPKKKLKHQEINNAEVTFNSVCQVAGGRVFVGGQMRYIRKQKGDPRVRPVLYYYHPELGRPERIRPKALGNFREPGRIVRILPNSEGTEYAVIMELLDQDGDPNYQYRAFRLYRGAPEEATEADRWLLQRTWGIGYENNYAVADFTMSPDNEIIATGTLLTTARGKPFMRVFTINGKELILDANVSNGGNNCFGGNAVVAGRVLTVSGGNRGRPAFRPDFTLFEEFLEGQYQDPYLPDSKPLEPIIPVELSAFRNVRLYEDTNFDLWLYGQHGDKPVALRYTYATVNARGGRSGSLTEGNCERLSVMEVVPDFYGQDLANLPAGTTGTLRITVKNNGDRLDRVFVSVFPKSGSSGLELTEMGRISGGIPSIGANTTKVITIPIKTTAPLSLRSALNFRLKFEQNRRVICEYENGVELAVGVKGSLEAKALVDDFNAGTTRARPEVYRHGAYIDTRTPVGYPSLEGLSPKLYLNGKPVNKGRNGKKKFYWINTFLGQEDIADEIEFDFPLDTGLNEIYYEVWQEDQLVGRSETRYVHYSPRPVLHYFGIAPDYSAFEAAQHTDLLEYNQDDVKDLASLVSTQQTDGGLYGWVNTKLFTTPEETTAGRLEDFFAQLWRDTTKNTDSQNYIAERDLVVVHIAAHGHIENNGDFVIQTADYLKGVDSRILKYNSEVIDQLQKLNRNVVIFIDACREVVAGSGARGARRSVIYLPDSLLRAGGITTFAAASVGESAYEDKEWGHGAFTKAILEALSGTPGRDTDKRRIILDGNPTENIEPDGMISVAELERYLRLRVPALIGELNSVTGKQQPRLLLNSGARSLDTQTRLFALPPKN